MIGMGRHTLVKVAWCKRQDNGTHAGQVANAQIASAIKCASCGPDLASLDQGFDDWQLAVRGSFLYGKILT